MTVIAIDGTFASGKGTLAKRLAEKYRLAHLDSGKLYRACAYDVLQAGGNPDSAKDAAIAARNLDPKTLSDPILKSGAVGAAASKVAVHPEVREAFITFQRDFAAKGAVIDGRDIGTVICPDADAKLYIDAEPEERAKRRHAELLSYGEDITYKTVLAQLKERDARDSGRILSPLKPAKDAHLLDTTNLSIDEAFERAAALIQSVLNAR